MGIQRLRELLPQLENVYNSHNWGKVELLIGIDLPADYKEFIDLYGGGQLDEFLLVLSPFEENKYRSLIERIIINKENNKILKEQLKQSVPYPELPLENSLLQFGVSDNGDELFWKINKNTENWQIVVNESRSSEYQEFNLSFVEFLTELLLREIKCEAFPSSFPMEIHSYQQFSDQV